jgi:hypothetical protein
MSPFLCVTGKGNVGTITDWVFYALQFEVCDYFADFSLSLSLSSSDSSL